MNSRLILSSMPISSSAPLESLTLRHGDPKYKKIDSTLGELIDELEED